MNNVNPQPLDQDQFSPDAVDRFLDDIQQQLEHNRFDVADDDLLKRMVESLADSRGMVRLSLVEAFGKVGRAATPFLMTSLKQHPNPVVRRSSAKALAVLADQDAVPALIHTLLNDEDTVVRGSSAGALAKMGKAAVPALLNILASDYPTTAKGQATWALSFIGSDAKEDLYQSIHHESAEVRTAVVGAIGKVADETADHTAFEVLINALTDPSELVRSNAAAILATLTYQPAIPHLLPLLSHSSGDTRKSAALALMKMGDRSSLGELRSSLANETEPSILPILQLAISQLEQQSESDDWE